MCCHRFLSKRRIPVRIDLRPLRNPADIDADPSGIGLDIKMMIDISLGRLGGGVAADPPSNGSSSPEPQLQQSPPPSPRRRHPAGAEGSQNEDVLDPLIHRPFNRFFKE